MTTRKTARRTPKRGPIRGPVIGSLADVLKSLLTVDSVHLLIRKDGVLCTKCGTLEPVHAGHGTVMVALLHGYAGVLKRHPPESHEREGVGA